MEQTRGSFAGVFRRELRRMTSRRLYFGVCVVLPLFCVFFMATIFGSGRMENIPVGVVDLDCTATSRQVVRTIESVPTFRVTRHFADEESAREATVRKEIYGYLVIPSRFETDLGSGRGATLAYYYHYALLSVGSEIRGAFETVLQPLSMTPIVTQAVALGVEEETVESFLVPVVSQSHPLYNPDLDYSVYLSQPFFFVLFQILILLVTVYALGSEIKFRTWNAWLRSADMNIFKAVTGKLLPYTVIFIAIGVFADYVLFGVLHIPFSCGFWPLNLNMALFVVATQCLAVFLFSLFPAIGIVISAVSMVGSLGATLSGVTFPVPFMYKPVYYASFLFPVRHFVEINQNLLYSDAGFAASWQSVAALLLFLLLPLPVLPHLEKAILSRRYENIE